MVKFSALFCGLFLFASVGMQAQLNLKIGYRAAFGDFDQTNYILSLYDPDGLEVQQEFSDLNYQHGIEVGLGYRVGNLGFSFDWHNLSRDRTAVALNRQTEQFFDRKYVFSINTFSLGVDQYFGMLGLGTAIQSRRFKSRRDIGDNSIDLTSQHEFALELHLIIEVQRSDWVAFQIIPFWQLPLSPYDLSPLAADINIPSGGQMPYDENLHVFGISFVFYNGRQY